MYLTKRIYITDIFFATQFDVNFVITKMLVTKMCHLEIVWKLFTYVIFNNPFTLTSSFLFAFLKIQDEIFSLIIWTQQIGEVHSRSLQVTAVRGMTSLSLPHFILFLPSLLLYLLPFPSLPFSSISFLSFLPYFSSFSFSFTVPVQQGKN